MRHYERKFGVSKHYFMKAVKDIFDLLALLGHLSGQNLEIYFESDVDGNDRIDIFDLLGLLKLLSN